jgi:hypothetical protein
MAGARSTREAWQVFDLARVDERQVVDMLQVGGDAKLVEEPLGAQRCRQLGSSTFSATSRS